MRNLTIYKLVLILSTILLLASCDTGYSGDIDPNKEIFNYKFPLQQNNAWEYIEKYECYNFSNDSVAACFANGTVAYRKIKRVCFEDSTFFSGLKVYRIEESASLGYTTFNAADTASLLLIKSVDLVKNSDNNLNLFATINILANKGIDSVARDTTIYTTPLPLLKYNIYIGDNWIYTNTYSSITNTVAGFEDLNSQRVCNISSSYKQLTSDSTTISTSSYSKRGLEKSARVLKNKKKYAYPENQYIGTYDEKVTIELIRTFTK